jgi:hypothetical protein
MLKTLKKIAPIPFGCLLGYAYWHFIGCASGACPITAHWHTSVLYGGLVGATFLLPGKKKEKSPSDSIEPIQPK